MFYFVWLLLICGVSNENYSNAVDILYRPEEPTLARVHRESYTGNKVVCDERRHGWCASGTSSSYQVGPLAALWGFLFTKLCHV